MSQYVVTPTKPFRAGGAIAANLRVKIASDVLAIAGITDQDIGVIESAAFASGDLRAVRLLSAQGTVKMVAAAAITMGANVYTAANGKVSVSASTAYPRGIAMSAATADGDVIEVLTNVGETAVT